jgi:cell division transport system permease protein
MARSLRPPRADDLGLRRALSDRLLPLLVAAMIFLASLALAGTVAAAGLAAHWRGGAAALLTVQVPEPDDPAAGGITRAAAVAALLVSANGIAAARRLAPVEVASLLAPWLGMDPATLSLHLPAVFEVRLLPGAAAPDAALDRAAPGTLVERNGAWLARLTGLAASLQAISVLALAVVVFVAAAVVTLATRAGLAARRDAIEIVHGLGATDGTIASQFASRITRLVLGGSILGVILVLPVMIGLARLAAPFQTAAPVPISASILLTEVPSVLWAALACMPVAACVIAWFTAQVTVRGWLARLP